MTGSERFNYSGWLQNHRSSTGSGTSRSTHLLEPILLIALVTLAIVCLALA